MRDLARRYRAGPVCLPAPWVVVGWDASPPITLSFTGDGAIPREAAPARGIPGRGTQARDTRFLPRPLRSRLTLCQALPAPRLATSSVIAALRSFPIQAASSSLPISHPRDHAPFCAPLPRPVSPYHPGLRLIHGSPGRILLRSAWRTRGGSLCACSPCSRSFVTFSGSKKERPQRRLQPINGVSDIFWRLS